MTTIQGQINNVQGEIQQRDQISSTRPAKPTRSRYQRRSPSGRSCRTSTTRRCSGRTQLQASFFAQNQAAHGILVRLEALAQLSRGNLPSRPPASSLPSLPRHRVPAGYGQAFAAAMASTRRPCRGRGSGARRFRRSSAPGHAGGPGLSLPPGGAPQALAAGARAAEPHPDPIWKQHAEDADHGRRPRRRAVGRDGPRTRDPRGSRAGAPGIPHTVGLSPSAPLVRCRRVA